MIILAIPEPAWAGSVLFAYAVGFAAFLLLWRFVR